MLGILLQLFSKWVSNPFNVHPTLGEDSHVDEYFSNGVETTN